MPKFKETGPASSPGIEVRRRARCPGHTGDCGKAGRCCFGWAWPGCGRPAAAAVVAAIAEPLAKRRADLL